MDSGHSSSLQSSSGGGGDDGFDSRTDSVSTFFLSSTAAAPQPRPPSSSSHNHHFLDSSLPYLDSTPLLPSLTTLSSSSPANIIQARGGIGVGVAVGPSSVQPPTQSNAAAGTATPPRSSKKRSRASRRAPTTVLTTDTSNFRAMVQEFTGIPSPPFAASPSPFARARLDLFHSSAAFRSSSDPPLPASSFLLPRPFVQKVQSPSFTPISSSSFANTSATVAAINSISNVVTATGSNNINSSNTNSYQLPSSALGLGSQGQPLSNMQSPPFTFQSLLQPSLHAKNNLLTMSADFNTRPQTTLTACYGLKEIGLPMDPTALEGMHSIYATVSGQEGGGDRARPRPVVIGNYTGSQQRVSSCKLNYSASSSSDQFNAEKGTESVTATRGEGMVDSWICSSD